MGAKVKASVEIDGIVYEFYKKVGENIKKSPEKVMADALLRFAQMAADGMFDKK